MGMPSPEELTEKTTALRKWGDDQQYEAEPFEGGGGDSGVQPKVTLLNMTSRPLATLAAFCAMYKGRVVRDLADVTEEQMRKALDDCMATHLKAPLESIKFHFLLEGVDRAFTHQLVRQRTAVYAQESLRFAVVGDLLDATTLPPSLAGTERPLNHEYVLEQSFSHMLGHREFTMASEDDRQRAVWDYAIKTIDAAYHKLVEGGMPAEEARGLLPQATATRVHYITDLRNLSEHAGNRLCTQAQFHWRSVFFQIVNAIRNYDQAVIFPLDKADEWQYQALAESALFRPVCYQQGKCPFKASFDRDCKIRGRVDKFAEAGVPSSQWHDDSWMTASENNLEAINPAEWALNPDAARRHG